MSDPVTYRCTICELPISGPTSDVTIGDGDGTGQRFAHGYCYWRREAGREKKRADDLEEIQRNGREMTKIFCDLCGREAELGTWNEIIDEVQIIIRFQNTSRRSDEANIDLCNDCRLRLIKQMLSHWTPLSGPPNLR